MKIHVIFSNTSDKDMVYLPITQKYSTCMHKLMTQRTKMEQGPLPSQGTFLNLCEGSPSSVSTIFKRVFPSQ